MEFEFKNRNLDIFGVGRIFGEDSKEAIEFRRLVSGLES